MSTLKVGEQGFSPAETASIVQTFHKLEGEFGAQHLRVRLAAANRALQTLRTRGFAKNFPDNVEI